MPHIYTQNTYINARLSPYHLRMYGFIFKIKLLSKIPFWCAILGWNYLRRINDVVMVAFENTSKCDHKNLMPTAKCQFSAEVNFSNHADLELEFLFLSSMWSNVIVLFIFIFDLICIHVKERMEREIFTKCDEMKWNGFFVVHLGNLSFEWIVNFAFQFAPAFNSLPMRLAKVAVTINSYPKNGNNFHSKNSIECMLETEANGWVYAVCHLFC